MSQDNVETLRLLLQAFRDRNPAFSARGLDPEIEWDVTSSPFTGLQGVYHGLGGVADFWRRWLDAWEIVEFAEPELIDAGDRVVVWIASQRMRGRTSGLEVDLPPFGFVCEFRDGVVVRAIHYLERTEALEAAGLSG